ncbi:hypothetical protein HUS70_08000 [Pandoraea nosoerga]|uniref:Uncharacterized protein n=1 Tax=Pandoraea nosoerga TaxID=2508296 RepID=A0A5E4XVU2_9BURK|nr:hypothetical protein [Pandoraea nosoerga]MBN4667517.1 hypothetical protein [Pandoraea nosoerga]MBN4674847.1 hypothetical protein [Pandoraea nosoerga]MBN4680163.1 hypothetical protein [Pandoraea nosoerga]MBN4744603.1 hypothetical protein [Pandoraea nosoerga]VVE40175.1 hypothetical protein PNO31109_04112 [Pandoraea nosoerga]
MAARIARNAAIAMLSSPAIAAMVMSAMPATPAMGLAISVLPLPPGTVTRPWHGRQRRGLPARAIGWIGRIG